MNGQTDSIVAHTAFPVARRAKLKYTIDRSLLKQFPQIQAGFSEIPTRLHDRQAPTSEVYQCSTSPFCNAETITKGCLDRINRR